jgi:hypothetical protein
MSLISDNEIAALRAVAESGMKTTATIRRRSFVETSEGQAEAFATVGTVVGWHLEITSNTATIGEIGGLSGVAEVHVFRAPWGTDIRSGDVLVTGDSSFVVEHTNADDTYPMWLICAMRSKM